MFINNITISDESTNETIKTLYLTDFYPNEEDQEIRRHFAFPAAMRLVSSSRKQYCTLFPDFGDIYNDSLFT